MMYQLKSKKEVCVRQKKEKILKKEDVRSLLFSVFCLALYPLIQMIERGCNENGIQFDYVGWSMVVAIILLVASLGVAQAVLKVLENKAIAKKFEICILIGMVVAYSYGTYEFSKDASLTLSVYAWLSTAITMMNFMAMCYAYADLKYFYELYENLGKDQNYHIDFKKEYIGIFEDIFDKSKKARMALGIVLIVSFTMYFLVGVFFPSERGNFESCIIRTEAVEILLKNHRCNMNDVSTFIINVEAVLSIGIFLGSSFYKTRINRKLIERYGKESPKSDK